LLVRNTPESDGDPRKGQLPFVRVMAVAETLIGDGHHR